MLLGLALVGCDAKPTPAAKPDAKAVATPDGTDAKDASVAAAPGKQRLKGKAVQLEKAPEAARKAFWTAVQAGRKQTAAKDYAAAIASYSDALTALPDHPRALSGRGYARLLAGELDAAEADLRTALAHPGTKKLESAIAFNLGLVAEKRGDQAAARTQFARANALHPGKAAQDKLAGGTACPAEITHASPESSVHLDWKELWTRLADDGLFDKAAPPADEAAAKKAICTSDPLTDAAAEDPAFDACNSPRGPWLVRHSLEWGGHALYVVDLADGSQVRLTDLGVAGGGRCGADSDAAIAGDLVTWNLREYAPVDVMEVDGNIVDCEGDNVCFSACGQEVDATSTTWVFSPRTPDPTRVSSPLGDAGDPIVQVRVEGEQIVVQGERCDLRVPLVKPPPIEPDPTPAR